MGITQGAINDKFRPLIRVALADVGEDFLALLDTGFNGSLLCSRYGAAALRVELSGLSEKVQLAGGIEQQVERGWLDITWLGQRRRVRVLVSAAETVRRTIGDDEPAALVGGALLAPSLVLLDYGAMTLEIEAQG